MTTATIQQEVYGCPWLDPYGFLRCAHVAISLEKTRVIFKCRNRRCKHVWAREYHKCIKQLASQEIIYRGGIAVRIDRHPELAELIRYEDGKFTNRDYDNKCPECGESGEGDKVVGTYSDKKCDARCTNAKGHNCECSCGGKNHGANHLA